MTDKNDDKAEDDADQVMEEFLEKLEQAEEELAAEVGQGSSMIIMSMSMPVAAPIAVLFLYGVLSLLHDIGRFLFG